MTSNISDDTQNKVSQNMGNHPPHSVGVGVGELEKSSIGEEHLQAPQAHKKEVVYKTLEEEVASLREQLSTTCKDLAQAAQDRIEAENNWLRGKADVDNVRKRAMKDVERARQVTVESFALSVLEVKDSLESAALFKDKKQSKEQVQEGISLTLKKFEQLLEKRNIKEVVPLYRPFDPSLHQAILTLPRKKGQKSGDVVQVIQKGYMIGEQLLRPALVAVADEESC